MNEDFYRSIFENCASPMIVINEDNIITLVNHSFCKISGYAKEELIGSSWISKTPPDEIEKLKDYNRRRLQNDSNVPSKYECRFLSKSGIYIFTLMSVSLLEKSNQIIVSFSDITERKMVEEELNKNRTLLNSIIKYLPDMVWLKDEDGKFLICNPKMESAFGLKTEDIIGKTDYHLSDKSDADKFRHNDLNAINKGFMRNEEWIYNRHFGKYLLVDTIKTPVYDINNKLIGVLGIARDITERKKLEEELAEKIFFFKKSQRAAFIGSFKISIHTELWETTEVLDQILGIDTTYNRSFKSFMNLVFTQDRDYLYQYLKNALETKQQQLNMEYRIIRFCDKKLRWVSEKATAIFNDKGEIISYYGTIRDITVRKENEQALKENAERLAELNNMKDKFFSIIAHDLRSPFNAIYGFSDLLMKMVKGSQDKDIGSMAKNILEASQLAMDLLSNLMQWTKSETGRLEFNPIEYNFTEQLKKTIQLFKPVASHKNISLQITSNDEIFTVADESMIYTVLRNLISNAIKFTYPNGKVIIHTEKTENNIIVKIIDNGVGIEHDVITNLFRIDKNQSTIGTQNEQGTGLGLILCKEFIEKHGGKINVESKINKGSVFSFTIPLFQAVAHQHIVKEEKQQDQTDYR